MADEVAAELDRAYREERATVLATLTRHVGGDLALAEDAVQDAFVAAAAEWPQRGIPRRPGAWLTTAARRRAIDRLRREQVRAAHQPALEHLERLARLDDGGDPGTAGYDDGSVTDDQLPERLAGVHRVVYLIFNEGHSATTGDEPVAGALCDEALRLARLLARLMPGDAETLGLLALLLLTDARRPARTGASGESVSLEHQDRSRWDLSKRAEGTALLDEALRLQRAGPYQVQAAIAALHAEAPSFAATDWAQIAALYATLERLDPSPVVTVNRAVAVAQARGPRDGLAVLAPLAGDPRLARYQPLHAARAELLRLAGDEAGADAAHRRAVELTGNASERAALEGRKCGHSS